MRARAQLGRVLKPGSSSALQMPNTALDKLGQLSDERASLRRPASPPSQKSPNSSWAENSPSLIPGAVEPDASRSQTPDMGMRMQSAPPGPPMSDPPRNGRTSSEPAVKPSRAPPLLMSEEDQDGDVFGEAEAAENKTGSVQNSTAKPSAKAPRADWASQIVEEHPHLNRQEVLELRELFNSWDTDGIGSR